ncbi:MAG: hypothetical protein ABI277_15420 [Burkholderiaceae bacterium]
MNNFVHRPGLFISCHPARRGVAIECAGRRNLEPSARIIRINQETSMTQNQDRSGPDADSQRDASLPHERDETAAAPEEDAQHRANRAPMRQAHEDVESGLVDTERMGTPNDVPSSGRRDKC